MLQAASNLVRLDGNAKDYLHGREARWIKISVSVTDRQCFEQLVRRKGVERPVKPPKSLEGKTAVTLSFYLFNVSFILLVQLAGKTSEIVANLTDRNGAFKLTDLQICK